MRTFKVFDHRQVRYGTARVITRGFYKGMARVKFPGCKPEVWARLSEALLNYRLENEK